MTGLALILSVVYLALAFGLRSVLQRRRTGSAGLHGVSGRPGSPEWLGGILFAVAVAAGLAAPVLALLDIVPPVAALEAGWSGALGAALAALVVAVELQVRVVEEPYLLRAQNGYAAYAQRTGRFLPGLGRLAV